MSKFSNFKIKCPKSEEKHENGVRLGPLRQNLPPSPKRTTASASARLGTQNLFADVFSNLSHEKHSTEP